MIIIVRLIIDLNLLINQFFLSIGNILAQNNSAIKQENNIVINEIICISGTPQIPLNQKCEKMNEL